jgi:hypothetical protein
MWESERPNISNGKQITAIFRLNRRMIALCELLGSFRRLWQRALCSSCNMERCGSVNVQLSPMGRKLRSFLFKIDEISRFVSCWARFYAYGSVHYVLRVKCSDLGTETSTYLRREDNYGHFLSKSTKYRVLPHVRLDSTFDSACIMFCV